MKRTIATALCSILMLLTFEGCCTKCPETSVIYIPQKCVIPMVEKPIIDNEQHQSSEDVITKAIFNYMEMKKYAAKLLAAQEVCR